MHFFKWKYRASKYEKNVCEVRYFPRKNSKNKRIDMNNHIVCPIIYRRESNCNLYLELLQNIDNPKCRILSENADDFENPFVFYPTYRPLRDWFNHKCSGRWIGRRDLKKRPWTLTPPDFSF